MTENQQARGGIRGSQSVQTNQVKTEPESTAAAPLGINQPHSQREVAPLTNPFEIESSVDSRDLGTERAQLISDALAFYRDALAANQERFVAPDSLFNPSVKETAARETSFNLTLARCNWLMGELALPSSKK